jgi:hypothetical protein
MLKYVPVPTRLLPAMALECAECRRLSHELYNAWRDAAEAIRADPGPEVIDEALRQFEQALERHRIATYARFDHERLTGHSVDDPSPLSKDPDF